LGYLFGAPGADKLVISKKSAGFLLVYTLVSHIMEENVTNGYPTEVETLEQGYYQGTGELDDSSSMTSTFVGKLRHFVPTLYCSLSAWERNLLDTVFSEVTKENGVLLNSEAEGQWKGGTHHTF
jgi:hypothetical protein